jgi:hypothetical protein
MDLESTITARRREIEEQARCKGCGTTLADCRRIREQNTDPTAPDWLGCCAIGNPPGPCTHEEDPTAVRRLLDEIDAGEVNPPSGESGLLHDRPRRVSRSWLLHQDEWWQPKVGPMLRIVEMDQMWRHNTAAFLLRRAPRLAAREWALMVADASGPLGPSGDMACDAFEAELDRLNDDPEGWLRETPLYRALIAGLPAEDTKRRDRIAERARHYSTCPQRHGLGTCTCQTS